MVSPPLSVLGEGSEGGTKGNWKAALPSESPLRRVRILFLLFIVMGVLLWAFGRLGVPSFQHAGECSDEDDVDAPAEVECIWTSALTDQCTLRGDIRVDIPNSQFQLHTNRPETPLEPIGIKPHPRKWDNWAEGAMSKVSTQYVNVFAKRHTMGSRGRSETKWPPIVCKETSEVPAVVLSLGGFIGGPVFHDFNEALVPLFELAHKWDGEVILIVADVQDRKIFRGPAHESFLAAFTNYPIRLLSTSVGAYGDPQSTECFSELHIGLPAHLILYNEEQGLQERSESKAGVTLAEFGPFLARRMGLDELPESEREVSVGWNQSYKAVMGVIERKKNRRWSNLDDIVELVEKDGVFRVERFVLEEMQPRDIVDRFRHLDVLVGVHGAGLTNALFLRPRAVLLQILPYGEWGPKDYMAVGKEYKNIAYMLGLSYMQWQVSFEDSSLAEQYSATDPEIADVRSMWVPDVMKAMNLYHSQDVTVKPLDFRRLLEHIKHTLYFQEGLGA